MTTTVVRVPFNGGHVLTVDQNGKPGIILKPAIEHLGIDFPTQLRKLKAKSWACVGTMPMQLPGDYQVREHAVVDVRTFLMLLATIDENRVSDTARPILIAYQAEVADAVEAYWTQGQATNPRNSHAEQRALPQSFAEALQLAADQAKRLEEQAPAVEAFNTYLTATGDLSVADAAKQLSRHPNIDLGQNRLFAKLRELAWIFKPADGAWRVYQRALDAGWLAERAQSHPHPTTGETVVDAPQVRVTPRGLAELHRRLAPGEQLAITAP